VGKHIFSPLFRFSGRTFLPLQILRIFFLIFSFLGKTLLNFETQPVYLMWKTSPSSADAFQMDSVPLRQELLSRVLQEQNAAAEYAKRRKI